MNICDTKYCTGCFACKSSCNKDAIKIIIDQDGRTLPKIITDKCINCGLCMKICPVNNNVELKKPKKCYAMWTKNEEDRKKCASGGLAAGIGRYFMNKGYTIFGAAYNDKFELNIESARTEEELRKFRGSKYVQADTGTSYLQTKKLLKEGGNVVFFGTPCQIAGLKKYLRKDYEKLFTVDIICHGVPPMKYLYEYCKEMFPKEKIKYVKFRGEKDYYFSAFTKYKQIYSKKFFKDLYLWSFLEGIIFRSNCYKCAYAKSERVSNITIGDYWGLDLSTMKKSYKGKISAFFVNDDKGNKIFNEIKNIFEFEERKLQEAILGNTQLQSPVEFSKEAELFQKTYRKKGVLRALEDLNLKEGMKKREKFESIPYRAFNKAKRIIKRKVLN